jgi:HEAT repeat protein
MAFDDRTRYLEGILEKARDEGNLKELIGALSYSGFYKHDEIGGQDYDGIRLRNFAIRALCQIGESAIEPVCVALQSDVRNLRRGAAMALGEIGDVRAMEPLTVALDDEDLYVRENAAKALESLGWQPVDDAKGASYWATKKDWKRCVQIGSSSVPALLFALQKQEFEGDRKAVADALGDIGDPRAVVPLLDVAGFHSIMGNALAALEKIVPDASLVEPLIKKIQKQCEVANQSYYMETRKGAVTICNTVCAALGRIGQPAISPLIRELQKPLYLPFTDHDHQIEECRMYRSHIVRALNQIHDPRAVEEFIQVLKTATELDQVTETVVHVLAGFDWRKWDLLTQGKYILAGMERDEILALGSTAFEPLCRILEDDQAQDGFKNKAASYLDLVGGIRAVEPLLQDLKSRGPNFDNISSLGGTGDARAIKPLFHLLNHGNKFIRKFAFHALSKVVRRPRTWLEIFQEKRKWVK